MPTFTPATLDRLIEPISRNPPASAKLPPSRIRVERQGTYSTVYNNNNNDNNNNNSNSNNNNNGLLGPTIQPALYATPETTPLPTSPSSFPPSPPFVINHKRRGPSLVKSLSQIDVGGCEEIKVEPEHKDGVVDLDGSDNCKVEEGHNGEEVAGGALDVELDKGKLGGADELDKRVIGVKDIATPYYPVAEREGEADDFFDLHDSLSISSISEIDDGNSNRWWKPGTPLAEYYDAYEEISSDSATRGYPNIEDELRQTRLNLLMEIERRKQAEDALGSLQNRWQMLSHHLVRVGLRLPAPPTVADVADEQENVNPVEEFCQQVVVTRCVADAVARACSRAEVEMEMKPLIELKNFEAARLLDRIHYYEAANREMCQRNQEAVEMARKLRIRNKRRKKWFWGSIALAVTVGSAAIAWSYLPARSQSCDDAKESLES